ncbi:FxsA family protein [Paracoccus sp. p4-l81]|uniref:FxsA family protein n=1 Tax=unclassified Paracoccus (in: a-proteobacteria) TaxID=2688777 RepID=UPI0035B914AE
MWLLMLFLFLPLIEIGLFIQVGGAIGLWPTIGLVVLSAVAGAWLMQSQGLRAWADMNAALRTSGDPTAPMAHGALIMMAGVLLMLPGFFTDAIGLALLIPPVRSWVLSRMARRVTMMGGFGPGFGSRGTAGGPRPDMGRDPFQDAWQADDPRYRHGRSAADDIIDADYHTVTPPSGQVGGPRPRSGWTDPDDDRPHRG